MDSVVIASDDHSTTAAPTARQRHRPMGGAAVPATLKGRLDILARGSRVGDHSFVAQLFAQLRRERRRMWQLGERRVPVHTRERAVRKKEIRRIPYPVYKKTLAFFWGGRFPVPASQRPAQ